MNKRPKKSKVPDIGAPGWMVSYGDLMTNLLCCFVMLFSFAIIDKQKFEEVANSMRTAFSKSSGNLYNQYSGDTMISLTPYVNALKESEKSVDDTDNEMLDSESADKKKASAITTKTHIENLVKDMGLTENIKVIEENDIVIFRVDSSILFDTGKADLKDAAKPVIKEIGLKLKDLKTEIVVQGHADDRPINTAIFPSNWELSTKRATNVAKYMAEVSGIEQKYLTATGNAEFKPIVPNDTEYNRQKNRRIDIVIAK